MEWTEIIFEIEDLVLIKWQKRKVRIREIAAPSCRNIQEASYVKSLIVSASPKCMLLPKQFTIDPRTIPESYILLRNMIKVPS
jgi:hypothetical protein